MKRFEWDEIKAARNARKHGVTFYEAGTVFGDDLAGIGPDPDHASGVEDREHGDVVRIISARPAHTP
jgi:uncharacterized DUF497 family protein